MGTVIGLGKAQEYLTLAMLRDSIRHMREKNEQSSRDGGEILYLAGLAKEKALYKKYMKEFRSEAA